MVSSWSGLESARIFWLTHPAGHFLRVLRLPERVVYPRELQTQILNGKSLRGSGKANLSIASRA
jgi:hypothetical protein